jgi:hypothetical protein
MGTTGNVLNGRRAMRLRRHRRRVAQWRHVRRHVLDLRPDVESVALRNHLGRSRRLAVSPSPMAVLNAANLGLSLVVVASSAVASFSYLMGVDLLASPPRLLIPAVLVALAVVLPLIELVVAQQGVVNAIAIVSFGSAIGLLGAFMLPGLLPSVAVGRFLTVVVGLIFLHLALRFVVIDFFVRMLVRYVGVWWIWTCLVEALAQLDEPAALSRAGSRARVAALLTEASSHMRLGLYGSGAAYREASPAVRAHFDGASRYVQSLASWAIAPQGSTIADLRNEVGRVVACILTGMVHHLPGHDDVAVPHTRFLRSIALRLLAVLAPSGILFAADWLHILPSGLRTWILSVSLLILAVGIAAIVGASNVSEWRSTVSMMADGPARRDEPSGNP